MPQTTHVELGDRVVKGILDYDDYVRSRRVRNWLRWVVVVVGIVSPATLATAMIAEAREETQFITRTILDPFEHSIECQAFASYPQELNRLHCPPRPPHAGLR